MQIELFILGTATSQEGKLWIQTSSKPGNEQALPGYSCPWHNTACHAPMSKSGYRMSEIVERKQIVEYKTCILGNKILFI